MILFHGTSDISTPNIDDIGNNGVFYKWLLNNTFCSPSRRYDRYPDFFGREYIVCPKDPDMVTPQ